MGTFTWIGTLITWPYTAGGRSRRGSPKAGTTVVVSWYVHMTSTKYFTIMKYNIFNCEYSFIPFLLDNVYDDSYTCLVSYRRAWYAPFCAVQLTLAPCEFSSVPTSHCRRPTPWLVTRIKSVLNLQMTYIIIAHIYEQWDRWGSLMYHTQSKHASNK